MTNENSAAFLFNQTEILARVEQFCTWIDLPVPDIYFDSVEDGGTHPEDLLEWCSKKQASLDWIIQGDARNLATEVRNRRTVSASSLDMRARLEKCAASA